MGSDKHRLFASLLPSAIPAGGSEVSRKLLPSSGFLTSPSRPPGIINIRISPAWLRLTLATVECERRVVVVFRLWRFLWGGRKVSREMSRMQVHLNFQRNSCGANVHFTPVDAAHENSLT